MLRTKRPSLPAVCMSPFRSDCSGGVRLVSLGASLPHPLSSASSSGRHPPHSTSSSTGWRAHGSGATPELQPQLTSVITTTAATTNDKDKDKEKDRDGGRTDTTTSKAMHSEGVARSVTGYACTGPGADRMLSLPSHRPFTLSAPYANLLSTRMAIPFATLSPLRSATVTGAAAAAAALSASTRSLHSGAAVGSPTGVLLQMGRSSSSSSSGGGIPCSTTLTIGDVVVPIPDYSSRPERVSWVMPGIDHTAYPMAHCTAPSLPATASLPPLSSMAAVESALRVAPMPRGNMFFSLQDPRTKHYLRWMAQKEALGQDMCLMGDPGPAMRWLVALYSYLTRRETRVLHLNRDVTESDLKQRREIRNGTLIYEDQSAVAAAKEGQLLVLEGLERVERNVLPVINNLLENREMHLDNGSILIHPSRFDSLLRDRVREKLSTARAGGGGARDMAALRSEAHAELEEMGFIRVSERFRVVGITVPVPPYEGNPLDPPLRSRFQCLYVQTPPPSAAAAIAGIGGGTATPSVLQQHQQQQQQQQQPSGIAPLAVSPEDLEARLDRVRQLRVAIESVNAATSEFATSSPRSSSGGKGPSTSTAASSSSSARSMSTALDNVGNYELGSIARQAAAFPDLPVGELLVRSFPWPVLAEQLPHGGSASSGIGQEEVRQRRRQYSEILQRCGITEPLLGVGGDDTGAGSGSDAKTQTTRQIGNVLRGMMMSGGGGDGVVEASEFIRSARLVGPPPPASDANGRGAGGATAVPVAVQQTANYILRIENIRHACALTATTSSINGVVGSGDDENTAGCGGGGGGDRSVVIADAVVATLTCDGGRASGGPGTYTIPIFMGSAAGTLLPANDSSSGSVSFTVADLCPSPNAVFTAELFHVLQTMLQLHATRNHICLLGPTGCGKTAVIREFARVLGYRAHETMHLYADMSNRDLFQRRTTDAATGNTAWDAAALVEAAVRGGLVILDGIDKLPPGMLSSLQQLLVDQSASLFDGTTLKPPLEYAMLKEKMRIVDPVTGAVTHEVTDADMAARKIFPIHPAFRVVATARPPSSSGAGVQSGGGSGGARPFRVSHDVTSLFSIVAMPEAKEQTLAPVLLQVAREELASMGGGGSGGDGERDRSTARVIHQLLRLRTDLARLRLADPKVPQLSFRQLLHLVRGAARYPALVGASIASALLLPLMTGVTATQVTHALTQNGFSATAPEADLSLLRRGPLRLVAEESSSSSSPSPPAMAVVVGDDDKDGVVFRISRRFTPQELALVPFVIGFYGNPVHEAILAWLARQFAMRSNILLIGNQGVGKNKVVDAFLSRLGLPRHYIQLHRDTTVGSLTITPTVEGGRVRWEDSPLVKAVQLGHCLVVDEIDKAPVEVVQILKGLIEDREMRLGDGRQIIDREQLERYGSHKGCAAAAEGAAPATGGEYIAIHPDFRIIVLANPPGFPFHGNDFFRECGDLFSTYVMGNPDEASQRTVLRSYAPSIPEPLLTSLVRAFGQLQSAFLEGHITYPFSLRELIAVVRHLSQYPQDGVYVALNNVFSFDTCDANTLRIARQILHHHLSPLVRRGGMGAMMPLGAGLPRPMQRSPEPLTIPFPARATTTAATAAAAEEEAKDGGGAFALSLPAAITKDPPALRAALRRGSAGAAAARCWRESYPLTAYAVPEERDGSNGFVGGDGGNAAAAAAAAFTEWCAAARMPFLNTDTDTVLGVLPVTSRTTTEAAATLSAASSPPYSSSSSLLSFLISRRCGGSGGHGDQHQQEQQLLLASVHLPPAPVEVDGGAAAAVAAGLIGGGGGDLAALGWPVGEVLFMDLTQLLSAGEGAATDITLSDFNIGPHHRLFSRHPLPNSNKKKEKNSSSSSSGGVEGPLPWPASAAAAAAAGAGACADGDCGDGDRPLLALRALSPLAPSAADDDDGGVRSPTVLIQWRTSGTDGDGDENFPRAALIDILAAMTPEQQQHMPISIRATGAAAAEAAETEKKRGAADALSSGSGGGVAVAEVRHGVLPVDSAALGLPAELWLLASRPSQGLVVYGGRGNTIYAWQGSSVAAITLPGRAVAAHFFTDNMAVVTLLDALVAPADAEAAETTSRRRNNSIKGILKLTFPSTSSSSHHHHHHHIVEEGEGGGGGDDDAAARPTTTTVTASFAWLPKGLHGAFMDVAPPDSRGSGVSGAQLQPSDLLGAVWVPTGSGSGGRASPSQGDIAYMVVEGADAAEGLTFAVYPSPPATAQTQASASASAGTASSVVAVDAQRHELVRTYHHTGASNGSGSSGGSTQIVVMNPQEGTVRSVAPLPTAGAGVVAVDEARSVAYAYDAGRGAVSIADMDVERVQRRYKDWQALLNGSADALGGSGGEADGGVADLKMEYSSPRKKPSGSLKHGEVDDKEHHGGNTWAGGTGGTDTAGLGGIIGPYRLDKGNTVHQVSPEEKRKVPKHLVDEAKRMGKEALKERLRSIGMTEEEYRSYKGLQERVQPAIAQLRTVLTGLKAAEGERAWLKGQADGIWDDRKIVEGIVGDKNVFKRRVSSTEANPFHQTHKKRAVFVLDVSASMYRFEGMDRRLTKLLESTVMIMEAFAGHEDKIDYAMIGHNGDSSNIPLVDFGHPPKNHKERMVVCQRMIAYAQYCWSGDNTVEAMRESIELVTAVKGDAYFVFVVSDANLRQYSITPQELTSIIRSNSEVKMFCIFIASIGQQASQLQRQLPAGHGYECMQTDMLPHVLRQIFTSVNLL